MRFLAKHTIPLRRGRTSCQKRRVARWFNMQSALIFGLTATVALVPVGILSWRTPFTRNQTFWLVSIVACIGPASAVFVRSQDHWQTDFATSMWFTISGTMLLFLIFSAATRSAWRLAPLLSSYMLVLALFALVWQHLGTPAEETIASSGLFALHIGFAVMTYGLITLAAVAGLAAYLQERALKHKQRPLLDGTLPSISDCDRLVTQFLIMGEGVLTLNLGTGIYLNLAAGDGALVADHKTIFVLATFVIIGFLLYAQAKRGLSGRRAARFALLAYLLLTLAYPGVKFVSDVLLR